MKILFLSTLYAAILIVPTHASACASGARCLTAPPNTLEKKFVPGEVLKPGSFNVLLNSQYHGLPKISDGTWYVTVDRRVLRIKPESYEIIEDVTSKARRAF